MKVGFIRLAGKIAFVFFSSVCWSYMWRRPVFPLEKALNWALCSSVWGYSLDVEAALLVLEADLNKEDEEKL